jgi:hypothetical protein
VFKKKAQALSGVRGEGESKFPSLNLKDIRNYCHVTNAEVKKTQLYCVLNSESEMIILVSMFLH